MIDRKRDTGCVPSEKDGVSMRRLLTVVSFLGVCAALSVATSSAGVASGARDIGAVPRAISPTTAVTLASAQSVVLEGQRVVLTGRVTPAQAGVPIEVWRKTVREPAFVLLGTTTTISDGSFSARPGVGIKTAYQVRVPAAPDTTGGIVSSNVVTVNVRPIVDFRQSGGQPGEMSVYVGGPLGGKYVLIQIRNSLGRWVTLRRVTLRGTIARASAGFSLSLPRGASFLRAHLPASQAAPYYVAGTSKTLVVRR